MSVACFSVSVSSPSNHLEYPHPLDIRNSPSIWCFRRHLITNFLQPSFQAILVPTLPLAPQIQRGFPVDIVRNTNLLTYFNQSRIF